MRGFVPVAAALPATSWREWRLPTLLFVATLGSTLIVGGSFAGLPYTLFDLPELVMHPHLLAQQVVAGVPFAGTLLGILGAHELGHYFTARLHRVRTTPPFFIPFPSYVGTLGAVIRMRSTIPTRTALVDIGASGPIAGFVLAVPMLLLGLAFSDVRPVFWTEPVLPPQSLIGLIVSEGFLQTTEMLPGTGLLIRACEWLVVGPIPPGMYVKLHPTALAAWFGLFVTALNLLPIGQLDGGHVLFAVLGRRARTVGRITIVALVLLGLVTWMGWLFWAFLGWKVVRTTHPPVDRPYEPLDPARRAIAWVSLVMLIVTFVPVPAMVP